MRIIVKPKLMRQIITTNFYPLDKTTSPNQFELYIASLESSGVDLDGQIFTYENRLYIVQKEEEE